MGHVLDLGVPEAYRHEAVTSCEEWSSPSDGGRMERITSTCDCGDAFVGYFPVGTFEALEDGDDIAKDEMVMEPWYRHVWKAVQAAGQFEEARANSLASSDDDGSRWVV